MVLFHRWRGWDSGEDDLGLRHGSQHRALRRDAALCQPTATGVKSAGHAVSDQGLRRAQLPKRPLYSKEIMNALTISARRKSPLN